MNLTEGVNDSIKSLKEKVVADVQALRQQFPQPAYQHEYTGKELWAKYGQGYLQDRDNPQAWQQTIEAVGEVEAIKFGRKMEQAMTENERGDYDA